MRVDRLAAWEADVYKKYAGELIRSAAALVGPGGAQDVLLHRRAASVPVTSKGHFGAVNSLVKRIKHVAFGMRNFRHYRIRALLYAGRPNWNLLPAITPP